MFDFFSVDRDVEDGTPKTVVVPLNVGLHNIISIVKNAVIYDLPTLNIYSVLQLTKEEDLTLFGKVLSSRIIVRNGEVCRICDVCSNSLRCKFKRFDCSFTPIPMENKLEQLREYLVNNHYTEIINTIFPKEEM